MKAERAPVAAAKGVVCNSLTLSSYLQHPHKSRVPQ